MIVVSGDGVGNPEARQCPELQGGTAGLQTGGDSVGPPVFRPVATVWDRRSLDRWRQCGTAGL